MDKFLTEQPIDVLPGVGWAVREKLAGLGLTTVAALRVFDKSSLVAALGPKAAEDLLQYAWGHDSRQVCTCYASCHAAYLTLPGGAAGLSSLARSLRRQRGRGRERE